MTDKKRKLIFFWNYLEWGGAQIYFLAIIKEACADWDVIVVLPRNSSPEMIRFIDQTGVKCEFLDFHLDLAPARSITDKLRRQFRRIRAEIASFRFLLRYDLRKSILHIEAAPWQSWILLTALALRRAYVFVTMHNFMPKSSKWREIVWKIRLHLVSRLPGFHIFASNQDTKDKLKGWVGERFWEKMKVTYTAVNPPEIDDALRAEIGVAEIRRRHAIDENKFLVLCVGQFIDRKGRWVFLDAARLVHQRDPDVSFVWLTPKMPASDEIKKIAEYELDGIFSLVLSESVGTNRHDVLTFFRIADVFALPSFVEGLPIALLESMALGLPSISTNIYAIPEAINHLETGILIGAGDSVALTEAILKLKNDPNLREKLSKNGRDHVLTNFDERAVARIAIESYEDALGSK